MNDSFSERSLTMNNIVSEKSHSARNFGIDALRILSMMMILTLHVLNKGGILYNVTSFSLRYYVAWLLEILCYCAVNCYGLISGYVGIKSKPKISSFALLWLRVVFYTLLITLVFSFIMPDKISVKHWLCAVFPVANKQYWYFTAYAGAYLFTPLLNTAINTLPKKDLRNSLIIITCVFSAYYSISFKITGNDFFILQSGYCILWLMILYAIGGYIRLYEPFKNIKKPVLFLIYFMSAALSWLSKIAIDYINSAFSVNTKLQMVLVQYTSPTILICAVSLLLLFSSMNFKGISSKIIAFFSPSSFSVYLIHTHPLFWTYFITDRFTTYKSFDSIIMTLCVIGTVIAIYLICSFADMIRELLFKLLHLKQLLKKLDNLFQTG